MGIRYLNIEETLREIGFTDRETETTRQKSPEAAKYQLVTIPGVKTAKLIVLGIYRTCQKIMRENKGVPVLAMICIPFQGCPHKIRR